jgi:hypothetical protein
VPVMNPSRVAAILRQALRASLVVPLVACGGTTATSNGEDSGTHRTDSGSGSGTGRDAGKTHDAAHLTDGGCDPEMGCATGGCACGTTTTCVDGEWQCGCTPCPPPVDSGNVCKPNLGLCQTTPIPLACFDGGLPDATSPDMPSTGPQCSALCGSQTGSCYVGPPTPDGGPIALQCTEYCAAGRFFAGFRPSRSRRASTLHAHFSQMAQLEAAAVDAFLILAGELEAHGAPTELVARAKRAARDEGRHWKLTRPLALRYGACAKPKRAPARPVRPLVDIALENAVEGCVRETYGAVLAQHQARAAKDAEVRNVMAEIADDETAHALLSWELAKWVDARLGAPERARVARARAKAVREMTKALSAEVPAELVAVAGVPDAMAAQRMIASLSQALWA